MAVTQWATDTGSTVASGLTAAAIEWNNGAIIDVSLPGEDLSSVLPGDQLEVPTAEVSNASNAGTFQILTVDDSADTLQILNAARTATTTTDDETGLTASVNILRGAALLQDIPAAKQAQGYYNGEQPPAGQFNTLIKEVLDEVLAVASRADAVEAGPSSIASSSFVDLDGAGVEFAKDFEGTDRSWTSGGNDGAYEDMDDLNTDIFTKGANRALHILTYQQSNGISRPVEPQLDVNSGTTYQFATSASGHADSATQNAYSHSFAVVTAALTASTAYDFNCEAQRYTGLATTVGRAVTLELPSQDSAGNDLVRFASYGISEGALANTTYADLTGYTTGSQDFTNGNKALVIMGLPVRSDAGSGGNSAPNFKLFRDATELEEWTFGYFSTGVLDTGTMIPLAFLADVTGTHTFKVQGMYNLSSACHYAGDNEGYFSVIELPATWNGDTLLRATASPTSPTTNTSYAELVTTGNVTTNGYPVLMMISGKITNASGLADLKFQVDGVDVSGEYRFDPGSTQKGFTLFCYVDSLAAGTHAFSIESKVDAGSLGLGTSQFAVFEMPVADPEAGDQPLTQILNSTGKQVLLNYTGNATATDAQKITMQTYERRGTSTLDVESIVWQSGTTVRATFAGTPDLSGYAVGDEIIFSNSTNSSNDGAFFITDKNDGAYWVEFSNAARTDATDNEASSSPSEAIIWSAVGEDYEITPQAAEEIPISFRALAPAQSSGQTLSHKVKAKNADGSGVNFTKALFTSQEWQATGA